MNRRFSLIACSTLLTCTSMAAAQQRVLVQMDHIRPHTLEMQGFHLDQPTTVEIEIAGYYQLDRRNTAILGYGWILNSRSRESVWIMQPEQERRAWGDRQEQTAEVSLPAGDYEAYYAAYPYFESRGIWRSRGSHGFGDFISGLIRGIFDGNFDWDDEYDRRMRKFGMIVRGAGTPLSEEDLEKARLAFRRNAVVSLAAQDDEEYMEQGFALSQPTTLEVYAIGEAREDGEFDYGWILDAETREKVWRFDFEDSEHAGGAQKNRLVHTSLELPAGRYVAAFVTDGSHSPHHWNTPPPYDPEFWGLTLLVDDPAQKENVQLFDYSPFAGMRAIVSLIRMHDDEMESAGFTLNRRMRLRIYAIGEGRNGDMFDYGWIVNASTNEKVWIMDYDETDHAGGSSKNRLFDGTIELPAGNYLAHYVTDGSHSYGDWNASRPFDPEHWGLSVFVTEEDFAAGAVAAYHPEEDPNILAQIIRVRDDADEQVTFTLERNTEVRIYAIGEGSGGDMYDYGWLEDAATGKVVWEMTYRKTEHAGGARKNREFNGTILLKAGTYKLVFRSDGSHSFNNWNASAPRDPMHWGITVYRVQE